MDPKSFILSALLELGSVYFLSDLTDSNRDLVAYFTLHATSSSLAAWVAHFVLPPRYRRPRALVLASFFCFAFFIPLLGTLGMLVAVQVNLYAPKAREYLPFRSVEQPEYVLSIKDPDPQFRMSGLKAMLLDASVPSELRLKSLIALQNMPSRIAGPMLRTLLADPSDDMRLLAYGMLDSQEKRINAAIRDEMVALEALPDDASRLPPLRHLAELNWELVYAGLVQGDVRDHATGQSLAWTEKALAHAPWEPGLWFLKARVLQAQGRFDDAAQAFSIAASSGLAETRAMPYLAELAYARREFTSLREYLRIIAHSQSTPTMAPIIQFWTGKVKG